MLGYNAKKPTTLVTNGILRYSKKKGPLKIGLSEVGLLDSRLSTMSGFSYDKWNDLEDSDDEGSTVSAPVDAPALSSGGAAEVGVGTKLDGGVGDHDIPAGLPPDARPIDLNNIPDEIANDPILMAQLREHQAKAGLDVAGGGGGGGGGGKGMRKIKKTVEGTEKGRHCFQHNGQTVYEWEQNLEEVSECMRREGGVVGGWTVAHGHGVTTTTTIHHPPP